MQQGSPSNKSPNKKVKKFLWGFQNKPVMTTAFLIAVMSGFFIFQGCGFGQDRWAFQANELAKNICKAHVPCYQQNMEDTLRKLSAHIKKQAQTAMPKYKLDIKSCQKHYAKLFQAQGNFPHWQKLEPSLIKCRQQIAKQTCRQVLQQKKLPDACMGILNHLQK